MAVKSVSRSAANFFWTKWDRRAVTVKILLVVQQKSSVAWHFGVLLKDRGYSLVQRCPMIGHELPETLDDHAGVVVFGGPMSANDEHLDGIATELRFMETVLASDKPFFGICLGGQILARALGARVYLHDEGNVEVLYTIHPTDFGRPYFEHPNISTNGTRKALICRRGRLLAAGTAFRTRLPLWREQAGIQFHPEITLEMIQRRQQPLHIGWSYDAQPKEAHIKGFELFNEGRPVGQRH